MVFKHGYSLFTNCSFDAAKNKLGCYKGEEFMETFYEDLREQAMKTIDYEKKEMIPLTDKENKSYQKEKVCYICKKEYITDENDKNAFKLCHKKSEIIVITLENLDKLLIVFVI